MDPTDGYVAAGFYNSGTLNLTNSTVTTSGAGANGLATFGGGTTTINGSSVSTSGDNALGLQSTGAGSSITTTNLDDTGPITITTSGSFAHGVQADTGGAVTLNGGSVAVTGTGSLGLFATGTGSQINATDVTVSTAGSGLSTANAIDADSAPWSR